MILLIVVKMINLTTLISNKDVYLLKLLKYNNLNEGCYEIRVSYLKF